MSSLPTAAVVFALCFLLGSGFLDSASASTITGIDLCSLDAAATSTEIDLCGIDYSDMLDIAGGWMSDDRVNVQRIFETRQQARETKDVIQLNCVNENLCAARSYLEVAEQAFLDLQVAVSQDDRAEAELLFLVSHEAWKRIGELRTGAEQCVGAVDPFIPPEVQVDVCPGHEPPPDYFPDLPACPVPAPGTLALLGGLAPTLARLGMRRTPPR